MREFLWLCPKQDSLLGPGIKALVALLPSSPSLIYVPSFCPLLSQRGATGKQ